MGHDGREELAEPRDESPRFDRDRLAWSLALLLGELPGAVVSLTPRQVDPDWVAAPPPVGSADLGRR